MINIMSHGAKPTKRVQSAPSLLPVEPVIRSLGARIPESLAGYPRGNMVPLQSAFVHAVPALGARRNAFLQTQHVQSSRTAQPRRHASRAALRWAPAMGLRAVENFDGSFVLDEAVESILVSLLSADEFKPTVAKQGSCESSEFTGLLFQPVPYSPGTPRGMPQELERYLDDPNYVIINVPPQYMFKARCFKPSRLCAVFKRIGVPQSELDAHTAKEDLTPASAAEQALKRDTDPWSGLGTLIQESFHANEPADDEYLDSMVV